MIVLTAEERQRFAEYLQQEAETEQGLVNQLHNLAGPAALIARQREAEIKAIAIVAARLMSIEDTAI